MSETPGFPLRVVDALTLPPEYRKALRPGEEWKDSTGRTRQLPRYFYEVPSWDSAMKIEISSHFLLWEFIQVDVREAPPLRTFPRYVPCAITLLAVCLERFREAVGTFVHISANGGYRSPAHQQNRGKTPHNWGTAADIYRVGDTYLNDEKSIAKYAALAESLGPQVFVRPYLEGDDHLHIDLGFVTVTPPEMNER